MALWFPGCRSARRFRPWKRLLCLFVRQVGARAYGGNMSEESKAKGVWEEGDVANSEVLQAAAAGADLETWRDANLIAPMLDFHGLARAIYFITQAGGLGYMLSMHTPDLLALGLSPAEAGRFESLPDIAAHLLAFRYKIGDQSTRLDLANELIFRGVRSGYDLEKYGLIGWCLEGRRVVDRVLVINSFVPGVKSDMRQVAQVALRAGARVVTFWRWSPSTRITVTDVDRVHADELRMITSVLGITVEDVLLVCPSEAVSMAILGQWQR